MVIDLVPESGCPELIEVFELVEIHRESIGHDEPVKGDCKPRLTKAIHLRSLAQNFASGGDQNVLTVVGINVIRDQALDWPGETSIQAIHEHGFEDRAFKQNVISVSVGN